MLTSLIIKGELLFISFIVYITSINKFLVSRPKSIFDTHLLFTIVANLRRPRGIFIDASKNTIKCDEYPPPLTFTPNAYSTPPICTDDTYETSNETNVTHVLFTTSTTNTFAETSVLPSLDPRRLYIPQQYSNPIIINHNNHKCNNNNNSATIIRLFLFTNATTTSTTSSICTNYASNDSISIIWTITTSTTYINTNAYSNKLPYQLQRNRNHIQQSSAPKLPGLSPQTHNSSPPATLNRSHSARSSQSAHSIFHIQQNTNVNNNAPAGLGELDLLDEFADLELTPNGLPRTPSPRTPSPGTPSPPP